MDRIDHDRIFSDLREALGLALSGNSLPDAIELAGRVGIQPDALTRDLLSVVLERTLLWLIGDVRPDLNFAERRHAVVRRLRALTSDLDVSPTDPLVAKLAAFQAAVAVASRKPTRESLARIDEVSCFDVLRLQRFRCAVCGVPVREEAVRPSSRFGSGYEPVVPATLDHVLPYYLVGNMTPYEILCRRCNLVKRDRLGVHEDGFVLAGNFLRRHESDRVRHRVAFWVLWTERKCRRSGCTSTAADGLMLVERLQERSPFSLDNVQPVCEAHAAGAAWWLHVDLIEGEVASDDEDLSD